MPIMMAILVQMQATLVQMHALLLDVQPTAGQLLASQARVEQLHSVNSHNSMARVSNSHAQQGLSTLMPLQSEASGHASSHSQKP